MTIKECLIELAILTNNRDLFDYLQKFHSRKILLARYRGAYEEMCELGIIS